MRHKARIYEYCELHGCGGVAWRHAYTYDWQCDGSNHAAAWAWETYV